jgi:hypothetical protein
MSRLGNEWTNAEGNIMRFRDSFIPEKVDTKRLPYSAQVDGLVYHSNLPRINLGGRTIDFTKPLAEEDKAILRQTLPKSKQEFITKFQEEFKKKVKEEGEKAKTEYFLKNPKGQRELGERAYQNYLNAHPWKKFMQTVVDGIVKTGDFLIPLGQFIGMPSWVADFYKKFAPPGSKFYTKGDLGTKFKEFGKEQFDKQVAKVKGAVTGQIASGQLGQLGQQIAGDQGKRVGQGIGNILKEPAIQNILKDKSVQDLTQKVSRSLFTA